MTNPNPTPPPHPSATPATDYARQIANLVDAAPAAEHPVVPASSAARRRGVRPWHIAVGVLGAAGVLGATLAVVLSGGPDPISRADVMTRYATLAPSDRSSTPETIDDLAATTCRALAEGHTTDSLITVATKTYGPNATEVMRLFVHYRCPERLGDFK